MVVLVTGANGQLGNEMQIVAKQSSDKYVFTDVCDGYEKLDITDMEAIRKIVKENNIKCIVNCAAWTNVDAAETAGEIVETLNATAPDNLAIAMKEVNGLLVHVSTDYVFGGDPYNTPCKEDQKGTPTGVYGLTKLHGEQKIQATGCNYVILRTAWLYSEFGKNFVKTMLNLTATKPQLKVVFDQVGTPTYALDLAKAISTIIEDYKKEWNLKPEPKVDSQRESQTWNYAKTGIYHFSNEGVCSWFDFTKMIAEYVGNTGCEIQPCHSDEFPSPVKRPAYSVLDKTKVKEAFGIKIPYWTDSLRKCLSNICMLMLLFCVATPALANEVTYTGTIPCVFVNTENGTPIESKTEYVNATMNIETFGFGGYDNIGTNEQPLNIQIRGRGNWTWRSFDKKPYKIKLEGGSGIAWYEKK